MHNLLGSSTRCNNTKVDCWKIVAMTMVKDYSSGNEKGL